MSKLRKLTFHNVEGNIELIIIGILLSAREVLHIFHGNEKVAEACGLIGIIGIGYFAVKTMVRISEIEEGTKEIKAKTYDTHSLIRSNFSHFYEGDSGFVIEIENTGNHFLDFRDEFYALNAPLQYELSNKSRLRSHIERLEHIEPYYFYPIFADKENGIKWMKGIRRFFKELIEEEELKGNHGELLRKKYKFYVPDKEIIENSLNFPWSMFVGRCGDYPLALIYLHQNEFFNQITLVPRNIIGIRESEVVNQLTSYFNPYKSEFKEFKGIDEFLDYLDKAIGD